MNNSNKDTSNIKYYKTQPISQDEQGDLYQFISLILGIFSFILRIKWSCWLSLIFLLSSYVNTKFNSDQKQYFMNFTLIIIAFIMVYMPHRQPGLLG